jgi:hypothetical protein
MDSTLVALYGGPLVGAIVTVIVTRALERRPRLVSYLVHANAVPIKVSEDNSLQARTHSIVVRNDGRKSAKNVRLGHACLPNFSVYPFVQYSVEPLPSGGAEIVFPSLVPGEQITVAYLYFPPLLVDGVNTQTKSDEGFAKILRVLPSPQPTLWAKWGVYFLMYLGAATLLRGLFELGRWLWRISTQT